MTVPSRAFYIIWACTKRNHLLMFILLPCTSSSSATITRPPQHRGLCQHSPPLSLLFVYSIILFRCSKLVFPDSLFTLTSVAASWLPFFYSFCHVLSALCMIWFAQAHFFLISSTFVFSLTHVVCSLPPCHTQDYSLCILMEKPNFEKLQRSRSRG